MKALRVLSYVLLLTAILFGCALDSESLLPVFMVALSTLGLVVIGYITDGFDFDWRAE